MRERDLKPVKTRARAADDDQPARRAIAPGALWPKQGDSRDWPHLAFIVQLLQFDGIGRGRRRFSVQGSMDASGDEERVQPRSCRAYDVRPNAVADCEHAVLVDRGASNPLGER